MADLEAQRSSPRENAFAELLRRARTQAGLRQEDVARTAGVPLRTISRWEAGVPVNPQSDEVRAVCIALHIPPIRAAVALGILDEEDYPLAVEASRSSQAVAATIRNARLRKRWTQQILAKHAGIPVARLDEIESSFGSFAEPDEVRPLYDALGIPRIQLVAAGYDDDLGLTPTVDQIMRMLRTPDIPDEAKQAFIDCLRQLRESSAPSTVQTASQRFCAAIGKPHQPLSPEEKAAWVRLQDEVDNRPYHRRSDPRRDVA
ncbi:helix-turn-helix domain-containing protein [Plantactinospora sp. WMMB782]|uniref:helix-turn-helix domain-containing protein n=1 Tax=Plantactinospora sp. WMMB782 TaxID=3404121 RepID=UPI003B9334AD